MSTITLKNVPIGVHEALKARAEAHGRSLNKEIIATLEGSLRAAPVNAAAILEQARAVRESVGVYVTQKDLSALKNAGRR
jgi:plasmid stability protein